MAGLPPSSVIPDNRPRHCLNSKGACIPQKQVVLVRHASQIQKSRISSPQRHALENWPASYSRLKSDAFNFNQRWKSHDFSQQKQTNVMSNMGRGMERDCFYFLSFIHDRSIQEIVNILWVWPIARWCDDSVQGVWQQCKTEILIFGQQKKEIQLTCTTTKLCKWSSLQKNWANTSSIWSKSRYWQKSIAHIYNRWRWCTFFKPAYFLG